jgi:hypothetical protein
MISGFFASWPARVWLVTRADVISPSRDDCD